MLAVRFLRRTLGAATLALAGAFVLPASAQNVIQSENAKTAGVTTAWQIPDASYANNQEIEGYASATSINRGESINLYVQTKTSDPTYTINIYRIGWYGGAGGRLVHGPVTRSRTAQPSCPMTDTSTRLIECNWTDPYVLTVPNNTADATDWASGVYLAKLTGGSTGKQSYIIFVVRDDNRTARAMFQTSVTTYAAYNHWGGYNFYDSDSLGGTPAHKVSFNRPYKNPQRHLNGKGAGEFLSWEINMLRFVEREGYDVKYSTNIDTHVAPARLLQSRVFLSVGHDEYYTRPMYDALEAARDAGVNLAFIGANAIYWQVRLEPHSQTGQANRTVVGYKYYFDPDGASNPSLTTYLWREAPLNRPEAALIGVMYDYNSLDSDVVIADCSSWVCAGANLLPGNVLPGMLGYEVDRIAPSSPAGITVIASSPYVVNGEVRYSQVTYYTAPSGAGVFATGSMQWTWGLDSFTAGASEHGDRTNAAVQQITRNVLDRFTDAGNATPQITTSPVTAAMAGTAYSYDVNATDADGDTLTYALTQAPSGMTINASTGLIGWLPSAAQVGSQAVTVRVSDPGGLNATQSFTITVAAANVAPQITTTALISAAVGVAYSYDVNATDANGDTLTYALTQAPSGMTIQAGTGLIAWTPTAAQAGSQAVTVRVSDPGGLFATQSFTITVTAGNVAPQITTTAVTTATVGGAYAYDVNATDANGDTLTYALTQGPAGMTINTTNGLIAWTPTAAQAGSQAVTVRVSDPGGLFTTQSFTITVAAANVAPQITTTAVTTATVGVAYSYDVNATDANGDTLTYSLAQGPAGMTINTTNGLIAWTPTAGQTGSQAVTVRVSDPGGLFVTQVFTITVGGGTAPSTTRADLATPSTYTAVPGGTVAITLNWYRVRMAADYLQFMHLVNAAGAVWSVDDHFTTSASWTSAPFSQTRTISVPAGLPAGTYDIRVGLSGGNPWTDLLLVAGSGVTDPDGSHRYKVGTLTVTTGAVAPQITTTALTTGAAGTAYSYDVNATDANGDTLTYALTTAPSGMTINASSGLIAWTPTAAQVGNQAVTVRVSDPGGLAATQSFTIVVVASNVAPQITTSAVTTAAVGVAYSYDVNATDGNGDTLTYSLTTAPAGMTINASTGLIAWTPTAAQAGNQAVTVRVSDPGGLAATQSFTVAVAAANVAPQITSTAVTTAVAGSAYSYDVNATDGNGDTLTYALTTSPAGMTINASSGLIAWTPTAAQVGNQAVTVRVSDPGGLAATQSFTIAVAAANVAPQITTTAVTTATTGTAYSYDVNATDANGDTLTYALTASPTGMTINASTGLIAWTPTLAQAGNQAVTVRVSDPGGLAATQSFTIAVTAANVAPQITTTAVTSATAGSAYSYDVNATDANGDTLTYALTASPAGMTINAGTGLIAWTPTAAQVGNQAVTVRVSDPGGLAATQSFTVAVAAANVAPQITTTAVTTATAGTAYSYDVNATDANGDTLTYALTASPAGMTINAGSGLIAWTPTAAQVGNQAVTVRVSDPGGLAATQSFTIAVAAAPNVAPQITTTAVTTAAVGAAYSYDVNATDANGDTLTYALTAAPTGMTINATTGLIAWTPTAAQVGNQAVTVRVSDPGGLAATQSFTVAVSAANVAPQITTTAVTTARAGTAYSYDVNATDANGDTLTYSLTTAPTGMTINASTGLIAWTPTAAQVGNRAVTVRVSDPGGLAATQSFTVVVAAANAAPQITTTAVTTATVGAAYSYDVNATDANGDTLTYALTTAPSGMTINASTGLIAWTPTAAQAGNQAVVVRVSDPGGLAATQSFTVVVSGAAPATTRVDLATPASYSVTAGATVSITLNWYRVRMAGDYLQFMHLIDASGQVWSVDDHWTTSASWTPGLFSQTRTITVPGSMPPGTYDIRVGLSGGNPWTDFALVAGTGVTDPDNSHRYKVGTLTVR